MSDAGWSVVYVSQGPLAAEVAKSKLESHGIVTVLRYEPIGRALGLTVDGLGKVEVLVSEADLSDARALLEEGDEPVLADDGLATPDEP